MLVGVLQALPSTSTASLKLFYESDIRATNAVETLP